MARSWSRRTTTEKARTRFIPELRNKASGTPCTVQDLTGSPLNDAEMNEAEGFAGSGSRLSFAVVILEVRRKFVTGAPGEQCDRVQPHIRTISESIAGAASWPHAPRAKV